MVQRTWFLHDCRLDSLLVSDTEESSHLLSLDFLLYRMGTQKNWVSKAKHIVGIQYIVIIFKDVLIYLREGMWVGEGQRERDKETLSAEHGARLGARSQDLRS